MFNNSTLPLPDKNRQNEIQQYIDDVNHFMAFIQGFICIFGVLGNLLALIVINRKSLKNTSSSVFITYMGIFDTAVLLLHAANLARLRGYPLLHCSLAYLTDMSTFCANWILVIITLERCVAVYSPFLAKRFCTIDSARYSIYILLASAIILFTAIFPFTHHIVTTPTNVKCSLRSSGGLIIRIYQPILFYAIPDLLLLSNLFTVAALCQRTHRLASTYVNETENSEIRVSDVNSNRKQRQLTIMLVTISLSFYLFTTPALVAFIAQQTMSKNRPVDQIKNTFLLLQISVVFLQLNNATNFIFYCFAGQRFRRATVQMFAEYSSQMQTFYHRYILCNRQYTPTPIFKFQSNAMPHTTATSRGSCSPNPHVYTQHPNHRHHNHRHQHQRTSTM
ncbi:unnamed protein product [Adineta ricciae]|uniref:G-protein coupled receptors family 1 profile domain-containing protein n=1 Tax=Adineta ricciae TaxID=249248 RepID=A0A814T830_ADIRI|nr:unnamed protein product [Adineta ricciae]